MAQWAAATMKPLGHTGCENGRATPIGSPPPLPSMPCTPGARISPCCSARLCMWLTALAPTVAGFEADCCCRHVLRRLHCSTGACGYPSRQPPAASHQPRSTASTASTRPAPALGDVALARCLRITFRFPIASDSPHHAVPPVDTAIYPVDSAHHAHHIRKGLVWTSCAAILVCPTTLRRDNGITCVAGAALHAVCCRVRITLNFTSHSWLLVLLSCTTRTFLCWVAVDLPISHPIGTTDCCCTKPAPSLIRPVPRPSPDGHDTHAVRTLELQFVTC
jgi:hypothetical protein